MHARRSPARQAAAPEDVNLCKRKAQEPGGWHFPGRGAPEAMKPEAKNTDFTFDRESVILAHTCAHKLKKKRNRKPFFLNFYAPACAKHTFNRFCGFVI